MPFVLNTLVEGSQMWPRLHAFWFNRDCFEQFEDADIVRYFCCRGVKQYYTYKDGHVDQFIRCRRCRAKKLSKLQLISVS
jgi:hypothetical protein